MKSFKYVLIVVLLLTAYYLISPLFRVIEINEEFPTSSQQMIENEFDSQQIIVKRSELQARKHKVKGSVLLIENNENRILRFEDFETVNGPNLHIYLASDETVENFVDLGPIKATKGNVNYELPRDLDLEKYNTVLVYCVPFKAVFSLAELQVSF